MRVLLDTHVFLWIVAGDRRMTARGREIIERAERVHVSAASVWEVAIKARLGRIDVDPAALVAAIGESGFEELPVAAVHATGVADLPLHHADPFDRLLVAQAIAEPMRLLTADAALERYSELVTVI